MDSREVNIKFQARENNSLKLSTGREERADWINSLEVIT